MPSDDLALLGPSGRSQCRWAYWAPALVAALVVMSPKAVAAEGTAVTQLNWTAPGGCPNAAAVTASVRRLLANSEKARADLTEFSGVVRRADTAQGSVWRVRLSTRDGKQRALEASDCVNLGEMAALSIALALDASLEAPESVGMSQRAGDAPEHAPGDKTEVNEPDAGVLQAPALPTEPSEQTAAPVASTPEPAAARKLDSSQGQSAAPRAVRVSAAPTLPRPTVAPADQEPVPSSSRVRLQGAGFVGTALDTGLLGSAGFGLSAGGAPVIDSDTRIVLSGVWFPGRHVDVVGQPEARAKLALYAGQVGACQALPWRAARLGLCGSLESGAIFARGRGIDQPSNDLRPWWAGHFGLLALGQLGEHVRLHLDAVLVVPFTTYNFLVDDRLVHRIPRSAGRFVFAIELLLP